MSRLAQANKASLDVIEYQGDEDEIRELLLDIHGALWISSGAYAGHPTAWDRTTCEKIAKALREFVEAKS